LTLSCLLNARIIRLYFESGNLKSKRLEVNKLFKAFTKKQKITDKT
jgi:hypothetical protein